jgi:hypothetical protein
MKAKSDSRNWERDKTWPTFTGEEGAVPGQALAEVEACLGLPLLRGLRPLGCRLILCHAVWIRSPARCRSGTAGGVQNSIRLRAHPKTYKSSRQVVKSRDPPHIQLPKWRRKENRVARSLSPARGGSRSGGCASAGGEERPRKRSSSPDTSMSSSDSIAGQTLDRR